MANNLIPLQSVATHPRQGFAETQQQQFALAALQRKGEADQLALQKQQREQQDQQNVRKVLASGLPDDQAIQQLKMLGLHDAAFAYEKALADRNRAISEASKEQRLQHQADLEETAGFVN